MIVSMEWKNALAKAICLPPNALSSMSNGDVVATLFHDCIYPGIEIGSDGNTVDIPDDFNIKVIQIQPVFNSFSHISNSCNLISYRFMVVTSCTSYSLTKTCSIICPSLFKRALSTSCASPSGAVSMTSLDFAISRKLTRSALSIFYFST